MESAGGRLDYNVKRMYGMYGKMPVPSYLLTFFAGKNRLKVPLF